MKKNWTKLSFLLIAFAIKPRGFLPGVRLGWPLGFVEVAIGGALGLRREGERRGFMRFWDFVAGGSDDFAQTTTTF